MRTKRGRGGGGGRGSHCVKQRILTCFRHLNINVCLLKKGLRERDLGSDHEDICGKLVIIPEFNVYITALDSKYQSSFLFSFKAELMLLLAILNERFRWYFLIFANS